MKTLIHDFRNTEINIYSHFDGVMVGSFFGKKPEIGDSIEYFKSKYEVLDILENRDAKIQGECTHDPILAFFKLKVRKY